MLTLLKGSCPPATLTAGPMVTRIRALPTRPHQEVIAVRSVGLYQHVEGSPLTSDHITELISCLRDNIRSPDRKQLTAGLLDLRAKLQAAAVTPNCLQVVLFSFQDAVRSHFITTFSISLLPGISDCGIVAHTGEEGSEAAASEASLDVRPGQSAPAGGSGGHHRPSTR